MKSLVGSDYPKEVINLINNAKSTIEIVVYDWRWYENDPTHPTQQFNLAIARACSRGVIVRALLNAPVILDTLKSVGIKAKNLKDKRMLHAKMLLIDKKTLVIGSHNFTSNAFTRNLELSIVTELDESDNRIAVFFENLYT